MLRCFNVVTPISFAQEKAAPTTKQSQIEKIRKLKERVATKVAELKKEKKRAYHGNIKKISESTLFLTTPKEEITVKTDQTTKLAKLESEKREKIDIEDLQEGNQVTILGLQEKEELFAQTILVQETPLILPGQITKTNQKDGTVTLETPKEAPAGSPRGKFTVDYEVGTDCHIFEDEELTKCGLSKIAVGDRAHVVSKKTDEENRVVALRILLIPQKALGITGERQSESTENDYSGD